MKHSKTGTTLRQKLSFCESPFLKPNQQASRPMFALTQISLPSFESCLCFFLLKKQPSPQKKTSKKPTNQQKPSQVKSQISLRMRRQAFGSLGGTLLCECDSFLSDQFA